MNSIGQFLLVVGVCISFKGYAQLLEKEKNTKIYAKIQQVATSKYIDFNEAYLIDPNKNRVSLDKYRGKWLLIDFWSMGCAPCIKEFPHLTAFHENHKQHMNVIAVSVDNKFERYKKAAKRYGIGVPHFFGGYTYGNPVFNLNIKTYKKPDGTYKFMTSTPQYVLIDPQGKIIDKNFPKPSTKEFKSEIKKIIQRPY